MAKGSVGAKRFQEGLLVCILGAIAAEKAAQLTQHGIAVLLVERFERRNMHESHHLL